MLPCLFLLSEIWEDRGEGQHGERERGGEGRTTVDETQCRIMYFQSHSYTLSIPHPFYNLRQHLHYVYSPMHQNQKRTALFPPNPKSPIPRSLLSTLDMWGLKLLRTRMIITTPTYWVITS